MATGGNAELSAGSDEETRCARHPAVETALRCGRCDTLICPRCLVQTPVGARCPDCANVRKLPTVDVKPVFLLRGLAAALASGVGVGIVWGFFIGGSRGFVGIFTFFIAMGIGWAVGEAVAAATNRKRATALQACAVLGVIVAYVIHNLVAGDPAIVRGDLWGFIALFVAAFFAAQRVQS